jgi:hypothetical protein
MVSLAIEELPAVIKEDVEDFLENHPRSPAARLRPRMGMVGDTCWRLSDLKCDRAPAAWEKRRAMHLEISTSTSWNRSFLETVLNQPRPIDFRSDDSVPT